MAIIRRMDWPEIIKELRDRGWTQALLSERLNLAQSAISELGTGKTVDPRFTTGCALHSLYRSGERPEQAAA